METSISNEARNQSTDTQHELLQGRQPSSNTRMSNFGLVQRRQHGKHADTHSSKESTTEHVVDILSTGLYATTQKEDKTADDNGYTSACPVSEGTDIDVS